MYRGASTLHPVSPLPRGLKLGALRVSAARSWEDLGATERAGRRLSGERTYRYFPDHLALNHPVAKFPAKPGLEGRLPDVAVDLGGGHGSSGDVLFY